MAALNDLSAVFLCLRTGIHLTAFGVEVEDSQNFFNLVVRQCSIFTNHG